MKGKLAHWRKFYTNSSSLTYYLPTRTNITGLIASVLEMERDSYYGEFNRENLKVGIALKSDVRKNIFVMNYRSTKDRLKKMFEGYTQIKFEVLMPEDLVGHVSYRVFLASENPEVVSQLRELQKKVENRKLGYGVYLGKRPFMGTLEIVSGLEETRLERKNNVQLVETLTKVEDIDGLLDLRNKSKKYIKDVIPLDFNEEREILGTSEVVYELRNGKLELENGGKFKNTYLIRFSGFEKNITFL